MRRSGTALRLGVNRRRKLALTPSLTMSGLQYQAESVHKQDKQRGKGRNMKHDMRRVRDKSITSRQKTVGFTEHDLITSGAFRFRVKEIGYPPKHETDLQR